VGAGGDQSDEVGCADGAPAGLCGLDELERHCDAGCSRARALGDSLPKSHGGERRLNRICRAQMYPMLTRCARTRTAPAAVKTSRSLW
jgi:hypothetical protein